MLANLLDMQCKHKGSGFLVCALDFGDWEDLPLWCTEYQRGWDLWATHNLWFDTHDTVNAGVFSAAGRKSPPQQEEVLRPNLSKSSWAELWCFLCLGCGSLKCSYFPSMQWLFIALFCLGASQKSSIWIICILWLSVVTRFWCTLEKALGSTWYRVQGQGRRPAELSRCNKSRSVRNTHFATLLLLVACVIWWGRNKVWIPFLFLSYTWEAECVRCCVRTFLFREYWSWKLSALSTIFTHICIYI